MTGKPGEQAVEDGHPPTPQGITRTIGDCCRGGQFLTDADDVAGLESIRDEPLVAAEA